MIGQTVSHYKILKKLGAGGMGEVYKAEDTKLKRTVALKFLPPSLTTEPDAKQRFRQEAQAASALDHPNICTIHEIGETGDGQLFIAMACYDGETLKKKIERGPLKIEEAIDVAVQVAQGLTKAHEHGIVHRDIKPANVMVTRDGVAKIVDFGLAKLGGRSMLTKTGSTLGTAAYMSPEQAQGAEVDHRSDIWSLGVVLYEMLAGKLPFRGEHEAAILYSIVHEGFQSIKTYRADVPASLESVISGALQKDRAKRYQTAREIVKDLRKGTTSDVEGLKQEKSIIVLPFEDISPGKDNEYFSDGLAEEIIADLSKVDSLRVISRTSAMMLKGTQKNIKEIAKTVNVQYVLEGSVRKAGNNLRITAQLIDGVNDAYLWAEKYSGTLDDVFDIQEKVAQSIVDALKLKLSSEEKKRMAQRPIANAQAHDFYLRASDVMYRAFTAENIDEAIGFLESGLRITGDNALLLATLANAYMQGVRVFAKEEAELAKAEEYARRALSLDPDMAQAHTVLGFIRWLQGNPQEYYRLVKRALSLDPNDAETIMWAFWLCICTGKTSKALDLAGHMIELDPVHPYRFLYPAVAHAYEGRFEQAIEELRSQCPASLLEQPGWAGWLGWWFPCAGRIDDGIRVLEPIAKISDSNLYVQICHFVSFALKGERDRVDDVVAGKTWDCIACCIISGLYAMLGDRDEALYWLEAAVDRGFINYPYMSEYNPLLAKLRDEPRFKKLMERVKKEWEEFEV